MSASSRRKFWDRLRRLGFKSYGEYLSSDHWADLRRRFFAESTRAKRGCAGCRMGRPLQLHHRTYKRLGAEHLSDLDLLCRECHVALHANETPDSVLWGVTKRYLRSQNGSPHLRMLAGSFHRLVIRGYPDHTLARTLVRVNKLRKRYGWTRLSLSDAKADPRRIPVRS